MALAGLDHPRRALDQLVPPKGLGLEQDALAGQREALGQAERLGEILIGPPPRTSTTRGARGSARMAAGLIRRPSCTPEAASLTETFHWMPAPTATAGATRAGGLDLDANRAVCRAVTQRGEERRLEGLAAGDDDSAARE